MTRGLLLAADAVAGTQFEYAYHRLREDAVLVDVASPDGGPVRDDHGTTWESVPVADLDLTLTIAGCTDVTEIREGRLEPAP